MSLNNSADRLFQGFSKLGREERFQRLIALGALTPEDVRILQEARDAGASQPERVAREYFSDPALQAIGARYLRDNIKYTLGDVERAGLETFYRYTAELGLVPDAGELRFY